ncbi:MAG: hypothetical protein IJY96_05030 [Oscillospiraceae bacterium]|nr:hypothetical protein [Oscillospiraceae bacterium]
MKSRSSLLYILIFLVLAATVCIIFVVAPSADIDTAPVILPSTAPDSDSDADGADEAAPQTVEVNAGTVQAVLRTLSRDESYSRTLCAETFWANGEVRRNIDVWVDGDKAKLEIVRSGSNDTQHILIDGDSKQLWYTGRYGTFSGSAAETEADQYQSFLSYEHILSLPAEQISDAGYVEFQGEMCIYVRYISGELGYSNICYVSIASGLVMGEESREGENLVYRMSSTEPDLSDPPSEVFKRS